MKLGKEIFEMAVKMLLNGLWRKLLGGKEKWPFRQLIGFAGLELP